MIIKDLLLQLETSSHPVAKALHKGDHFKVLALAFKKDISLKEHKTSLNAKLVVLSGEVIYKQGDIIRKLAQYDETDIPLGVMHSVDCTEDALCILTQR